MSLHILLVHQAYSTPDQGGGTRHHELCIRLAAQGHRVTVLASVEDYLSGAALETSTTIHGGVEICRLPVPQGRHRSFARRLLGFFAFTQQAIRAARGIDNVDLVWGTTPQIFQAWGALRIARKKQATFVLEVRDLWPDFAVATGVLNNRVAVVAARWLERYLYRSADLLVINSPGFRDHVLARGATEERLVLIPNGVDTRELRPTTERRAEIRGRLGLTDQILVLYAGAFGPANDLDTMLNAAALLRDEPIHFVFVGGGKSQGHLQERANNENLGQVHFHPPVPKAEINYWIGAADICVATLKDVAEFRTVYPNKVFDYMAAGKPTVLAIEGVISDVMNQADGGIPVRPGDAVEVSSAIRRLARDEAMRTKMGRAAREYVSNHFSRARHAALIGERFQDARNGKPAATKAIGNTKEPRCNLGR